MRMIHYYPQATIKRIIKSNRCCGNFGIVPYCDIGGGTVRQQVGVSRHKTKVCDITTCNYTNNCIITT